MVHEEALKIWESTVIETKKKDNSFILKILSGFANTEGGTAYLYVPRKRKQDEKELLEQTVKELEQVISSELNIYPIVSIDTIKKDKVVKIEVKKRTVPIVYQGKYYKRVGNITREIKKNGLANFFRRRNNWAGRLNECGLEEINEDTVRRFVKMVLESGRMQDLNECLDVKTVLEKVNLIIDGKLTNAAIALFGKNPQKHFTRQLIEIRRFENQMTVIRSVAILGNMFERFEEGLKVLKEILSTGIETQPYEYPIEALHEALANSLIHRDYSDDSVESQIKIFEESIWFYNSGPLPDGVHLKKLRFSHQTAARNPLISYIFYLAGLIDRYGAGMENIVRALQKGEFIDPEFREEFGGFSLSLKKDPFREEKLIEYTLTEKQKAAVLYVKEYGKITNHTYQELVGYSQDDAETELLSLVKKGILDQKVTRRSIHFVLKSK